LILNFFCRSLRASKTAGKMQALQNQLLRHCRSQKVENAMDGYKEKTLSWRLADGVIELALNRPPANEIGLAMLDDLERFVAALPALEAKASTLILHSELKAGFSAGADLRELYEEAQKIDTSAAEKAVRAFLERIHAVLNRLDTSSLTTIAAVHGVCFGGGFELALVCDLIIADKMARFCFPELRLGLIPGFGGIPRLKRDIGNGVVRDLLLTGRSINATKGLSVGLVSQVTAEGEALRVARLTAAQTTKFDRGTSSAAKQFIKPLPAEELRREIDIFCDLFTRPAVMEGLRKFVENTGAHPYLP
jgi:enoyl-CoA hydratase/carnithine racemase